MDLPIDDEINKGKKLSFLIYDKIIILARRYGTVVIVHDS